jgi:hypothetical protein
VEQRDGALTEQRPLRDVVSSTNLKVEVERSEFKIRVRRGLAAGGEESHDKFREIHRGYEQYGSTRLRSCEGFDEVMKV